MLINRRVFRVEWGQCDPANIVFYPQYLMWCDACTSSLFERIGPTAIELYAQYGVVGIPLVDVHVRFIIPSSYGDEIVAESGVSQWGRSSMTIQHRLLKQGALAVECFEKRVWAATVPGQPGKIHGVPIPDEIKGFLSQPA